jgi:hypothetical protein
LCVNLVDPARAGAIRSHGPVATGVVGMLAEHGPLPDVCGGGTTLGLLAGHGPLRAARGRSPATAVGLQWTCGPNSSAGS